jgi:hypothetical protein
MQSAAQLTFPGSKTLAQWGRHLPRQRGAVWVGYLHLHRIEATVRVVRQRSLEPLAGLLLRVLAADSAPCGEVSQLRRLPLPEALLHQGMRWLEQEGLIETRGAACWAATERGKQVAQTGEMAAPQWERRTFPFVERIDGQGRRLQPPHYVPCGPGPALAWQVSEQQRFDAAMLDDSVAQPPAWKQAFQFPGDVDSTAARSLPAWRRVIIDEAEQLFVVLVLPEAATGGSGEVLGFAVRVDHWALADAPLLRLPQHAAVTLWPALATAPDMSKLRGDWLGWCRERGFPSAEAEACTVAYRAGHLDVAAPERLMQRLRAARSDVFRGDSWLLLGHDYLRAAVLLQVRAQARAASG